MSRGFKGFVWYVLVRDTPKGPWRRLTWRWREDAARAYAAGLVIGGVLPQEQIKVKGERV